MECLTQAAEHMSPGYSSLQGSGCRAGDSTVWHTGPDYQKCMDDYDVVFKGSRNCLERPEKEYRVQYIVSQTEVFFHAFGIRLLSESQNQGQRLVTTTPVSPVSRQAWMLPFWWGI